jgi:hypothetical protein
VFEHVKQNICVLQEITLDSRMLLNLESFFWGSGDFFTLDILANIRLASMDIANLVNLMIK